MSASATDIIEVVKEGVAIVSAVAQVIEEVTNGKTHPTDAREKLRLLVASIQTENAKVDAEIAQLPHEQQTEPATPVAVASENTTK